MKCLSLTGTKAEVHTEMTSHMTSEASSWQHMVDAEMLSSVPALKLFTSIKGPSEVVGVASNKTPPITDTHITSLETYRETVVYALHLVYEVGNYMYMYIHSVYTLRSLLFAGTNFSGFHDSLI